MSAFGHFEAAHRHRQREIAGKVVRDVIAMLQRADFSLKNGADPRDCSTLPSGPVNPAFALAFAHEGVMAALERLVASEG